MASTTVESVTGTACVLRGDEIDTDRVIPARFMKVVTFDDVGQHAFADDRKAAKGDHPLDDEKYSGASILIVGRNFGCGSSREHAPFALSVAGCEAVIAESYARIFYRNSVDGGFLVPFESRIRLIENVRTGDMLEIDTAGSTMRNETTGEEYLLSPLGDIGEILKAGNVFEYARQAGLIPAR